MVGCMLPLLLTCVWSAALVSGQEDQACLQERSDSSALLQMQVASAKTALAQDLTGNAACAEACRTEGYCCNDDVFTGANQYLSCFQACDIRVNGADEATCLGHCAEVAANRGCSRTFAGVDYGMCSDCADKTDDDKCKWSVEGPEACEFGCTLEPTTTTTTTLDCAQVCRDEGYCCNDDVHVGANQYLSCFQACDIRRNGAGEAACLGHCAEVAANRGCSRTFAGVDYGMCSDCADKTDDDKCKWSVGGPEACEFGCTLTTTTTTTTPDCAQVCREEGYCCNDDVHVGANQYLSCFQACDIRRNGAGEAACLGHCAEVAANRGCSRTFAGVDYGMCSDCADKTDDDKCKWSVGGPEACEFGCTLTTTTTTTTTASTATIVADCARACRAEGYCCNDDVETGANQYLSCFQACNIRKNGADKPTCLGYCADVAANRGCSRTIDGVDYGMCSDCADKTDDDKCKWSVGGPEACEFGCALDAPTGLTAEFFFNLPDPRSTRVLNHMWPSMTRVDAEVKYPPTYSAWRGIPRQHVVRFGAIWSGSLLISEGGTYTFYLMSDTGSTLKLDGTVAVDNDGVHRIQEVESALSLTPGSHVLELKYFQRSQGSCMIFSYSGPDTNGRKMVVPSDVLRPREY